MEPQTEALLGWVVRESATNAVRHSGANRCVIALDGTADRVRLTVTDDGRGPAQGPPGSGLRGLRERVAAAGGTLESGPAPKGGFRVAAELPAEPMSDDAAENDHEGDRTR
ncbi:ATP-binding protein [Streptomyces sp. NPDC055103]